MTLRFDPEGIERFKAEIRGIPGYPAGEDLPIREMVFESGALWRWNDVLWPLLVISDRSLYTITFGLAMASRSQGIFTGVALATSAIAILPIMILYLFLQRYIIRGIMLSGLKG